MRQPLVDIDPSPATTPSLGRAFALLYRRLAMGHLWVMLAIYMVVGGIGVVIGRLI